MSVPSVPFLKDQANRLVAYLGDKHRFRLKSASALEALAALYRHPDWNTLQALAQRAESQPDAVTSSAAPSPAQAYPVTWTSQYHPELTVNANDWFRHTLSDGGTLPERRNWLGLQLAEAMQRSAPGVFVNVFGATRAGVHDLYRDLELPAGQPLTVNLMADMEPSEIAAMLVALVYQNDGSAGSDYWRQSANYVLTIVAQALRDTGAEVTLAGLAELFPAYELPAGLQRLAAQLTTGSTAKVPLAGFLDSCTSGTGAFSENTWAAHYSVLTRGLTELRQAPWTQYLLASAARAPGLFSLLAQGKCLGVEWPEGSGSQAGVAVLYALRSALRQRMLMTREERASDWVFGLGELQGYLAPALATMAAHARSSRVAFVMTARDRREFGAHPAGRELLDNVWNTVHLRGCNPERLAELLARMADSTILVQPGRVTVTG